MTKTIEFPFAFRATGALRHTPMYLGLYITRDEKEVRISSSEVHGVSREGGDLVSTDLLAKEAAVVLDNFPDEISGHLHTD